MKTKLLTTCLLLLASSVHLSLARAELVIRDIEVIDLGTIRPGTNSWASDINDAGNIVGSSQTQPGGSNRAFITYSGLVGLGMINIGAFRGGDSGGAYGINELDQVVGTSLIGEQDSYGNEVRRGFIWEYGSAMRDLGSLRSYRGVIFSSTASAINNIGQISGSVGRYGAVWDLFAFPDHIDFPHHTRLSDMDSIAPRFVRDINNSGQVVGLHRSADTGFRWQAGVFEELASDIEGISPASGIYGSSASGINELGEVVGNISVWDGSEVYTHATFWSDPSTVKDLGTLGGKDSEAYDINDFGTVIGSSEIATGETRAFVWHADFGMQSLGTLGGDYSIARGINSTGQIVGTSETASGERHATLWKVTYGIALDIDIRPRRVRNTISPLSSRNISVVIFSRDDVDPLSLDLETLSLGDKEGNETGIAREKSGKNKGNPLTEIKDVDNDGKDDLILYFSIPELVANKDINKNSKQLYLQGNSFDRGPVLGVDKVIVKKPKQLFY
ncbi:MAG: hypothetical protein V3V18_03565 [Methylococcales bacterium]